MSDAPWTAATSPRWTARYVVMLAVGFAATYLLTRSRLLVGDAQTFVRVAQSGDPLALHFGEPSHFLQGVVARVLWLGAARLGLDVSMEAIFLACSLAGTVAAAIFVGLIAAELLQTRAAAWVGAILFGTSLHAWTQVNGELYALALGFVAAALFCALRGRVVSTALLWALALLSHSDFVLAGPALVAAIWMAPLRRSTAEKLRAAAAVATVAVSMSTVVLLVWSRSLEKWTDASTFKAWLWRSYAERHRYLGEPELEIFRALKGLVTAFTAGGHIWRDILTHRSPSGDGLFVGWAALGLIVIVLMVVCAGGAIARPRVLLFALVWLLPFHVLLNWWFVPTVEKYHAGALPGFVLLITAGLVALTSRLTRAARIAMCAAIIVLCASLNLGATILPLQALARRSFEAERQIRALNDGRGGRVVFVACDAIRPVTGAGVTFLRLRTAWKDDVAQDQQTVLSWVRARMEEGREPYLIGRFCYPDDWNTVYSREPFDLFFLERSFALVHTGITDVPIAQVVATDPFTWIRGDVIRIDLPKSF